MSPQSVTYPLSGYVIQVFSLFIVNGVRQSVIDNKGPVTIAYTSKL